MMLPESSDAAWLACLSGTDSSTVQLALDVQEDKHMIRNRGHYWQVKVYAGRDSLTGQERREYGRASTKRAAERLEAQFGTQEPLR